MIRICQAAWLLAVSLGFLVVYGIGAVERDVLVLAWLLALPFVGMVGWIVLEAIRALFDIALRLHTVDTLPPAARDPATATIRQPTQLMQISQQIADEEAARFAAAARRPGVKDG